MEHEAHFRYQQLGISAKDHERYGEYRRCYITRAIFTVGEASLEPDQVHPPVDAGRGIQKDGPWVAIRHSKGRTDATTPHFTFAGRQRNRQGIPDRGVTVAGVFP